ncbi:MAG TPA: hypothetical protein VHB77_20575, partial [Planctomycetaceae bacterium]|nr:hypothetical protein [Planctomycetaceae bacterium]
MDAPGQWSDGAPAAPLPLGRSETTRATAPLEPLTLLADRPAVRASYTCPGEDRPISRAVHLSRLASFYPACRECAHRADTGQLPADICERIQSTERRIERASLFGPLGVRGVYLNELGRKKAGEIAAAMASLLWQDVPAPAASDDEAVRWATASRRGPTVLVGRDDRPSSPDIATGVARSLCRMGCHVVDVGQCSRPTFLFAIEHLHATAGAFVSGSGHDPSWTGLDLVGAAGVPWNRDDRLAEVEHRLQTGFPRPARNAGGQRVFHPLALYEAGFWQHFHALRPLKVVFGCASRPVRETVRRIFERLACRLITLAVPVRARRLNDPADADALRFQKLVLESQAHLGILIEDDGQSCALFDERGQLLP